MRVEPFDHLLRILGEIVVTVEASSRPFYPEQFLVLGWNVVVDLLHVAGRGHHVVVRLGDESRNMDGFCLFDGGHLVQCEAGYQAYRFVEFIDSVGNAESFGDLLEKARREIGCGATMQRMSLKNSGCFVMAIIVEFAPTQRLKRPTVMRRKSSCPLTYCREPMTSGYSNTPDPHNDSRGLDTCSH